MIVVDPNEVSNQTSATLSCNFTNPTSEIKSHYWEKNGKLIEGTKKDGEARYIEYTYVPIALTEKAL